MLVLCFLMECEPAACQHSRGTYIGACQDGHLCMIGCCFGASFQSCVNRKGCLKSPDLDHFAKLPEASCIPCVILR